MPMYSLLFTALVAAAVPCPAPKPACAEWITLKDELPTLLVYRSYSLELTNKHITRALVFVHGINRDADNHFRTVLAAAFLAGALNNTLIVSPRFASNSSAPGNQI